MDSQVFHQAYDPLPFPVYLEKGEERLLNTAAQAAALPEATLKQTFVPHLSSLFWMNQQFYRSVATPVEDGLLVMLRPEELLSGGGVNFSGQMRSCLSSAFQTVHELAQSPALMKHQPTRERLARLNLSLYQILRTANQLDLCALPHVDSRSLDLTQLLIKLADQVAPLCRMAGVQFTLDLGLITQLLMIGDDNRLQHLFLQLISNSLKFTPKGGAIRVTVRAQNDTAIITLSDTGPGLSPDVLQRPLWNSPGGRSPTHGIGLGLPIAQRIAMAHKGSLVVIPENGGAKVVVSLPLTGDTCLLSSPMARMIDDPVFSPALITLSDALPPEAYVPAAD